MKKTTVASNKRESLSSDESSSDWEENTSYVESKDEGKIIEEESIITFEEKEKMISKDIQGEERQRFISLLSEFPKLFINDNSRIRGVDVIKHYIN